LPVAEEKKLESKTHRSLAEILGIPKRGEPVDQPKVAVVIDPKITKVLRPHQIEGVKVLHPPCSFLTLVSLQSYDGEDP
jgi:DNA repair and recombination RAD54-like protein